MTHLYEKTETWQERAESLQKTLDGWLAANAPGGWIDELRKCGPNVPQGWKLVPMEPTLPMKEAAALYRANCMDKGLRKTFGGYYRTMVGAAPEYQPPATNEGQS